jgi:hypothetical protein
MLGLKVPEETAILGAEFQISFLNQVVQEVGGVLSPGPRGAEDDC